MTFEILLLPNQNFVNSSDIPNLIAQTLHPEKLDVNGFPVKNATDDESKKVIWDHCNAERVHLEVLISAIRDGKLKVLNPKTMIPVDEYQSNSVVSIDEFTRYVKQYHINVELTNFTMKPGPATKPGLTKGVIISAFSGVYWTGDQWDKYLASPRKWLAECRVAKGNKRVSATWNPADIAVALLDKNITVKRLDAVFVNLKDWRDEWKEKSEIFRE